MQRARETGLYCFTLKNIVMPRRKRMSQRGVKKKEVFSFLFLAELNDSQIKTENKKERHKGLDHYLSKRLGVPTLTNE